MWPFKKTTNETAKAQTIILSRTTPSVQFEKIKVTLQNFNFVYGPSASHQSQNGMYVEVNTPEVLLQFEELGKMPIEVQLGTSEEYPDRNFKRVGGWTFRIVTVEAEQGGIQSVTLEAIPSSNNSSQPKIVETKTFSCPGMEGFTFEYPVFEGWETTSADYVKRSGLPNYCGVLYLKPPQLVDQNSIEIYKTPRNSKIDFEIPAGAIKNSKEIPYTYLKNQYATFYIPGNIVQIESKLASGKDDFPRDVFFQTVINSFRVIK